MENGFFSDRWLGGWREVFVASWRGNGFCRAEIVVEGVVRREEERRRRAFLVCVYPRLSANTESIAIHKRDIFLPNIQIIFHMSMGSPLFNRDNEELLHRVSQYWCS